MAQSVDEMINEYVDPRPPAGPLGGFVQMSARVPEEIKLMIETMAHHYKVKKSPFLNEIVIAAVQEAWNKTEKNMESDLLFEHAEEIEKLRFIAMGGEVEENV